MASLTGNLVSETYKALLKTIDNDILTASEKQITDGFGGGSNVFIDSNGFLRANKYKVTNGFSTQFLKADGSLDANTYLTSITSSQIIAALGFTPVTNARTLTINGTTYDLSANRSWTVAGTAAVWGNITGTLSSQTDLQNALNAKFNNPTGTTAQYIRGDGTLATLPSAAVWGNITGTLSNQTDLQAALDAKASNASLANYLLITTAASTYQPLDADLTAIASLAGTSGFLIKTAADTWALDTNTYLTTSVAASTYQRLDKMVSNLLASATEYPNSNAVIAALALKADAANPVFTGNMTISGAEPKLTFTDTDQNPDYFIGVDAGFFRIYDQTAGLTRFVINSSGVTTIAGDLIVGTIAKTGGTASQFLKADGTIDSSTYVTSATLANYLLSATAATTYQTLANLSTDLTASATKYPSVNAVVTGLGTKQPLDADLTAIAALVGTTGFLIKTAADTWSLDTNTYLTTASAASTYLTQTTAASTYQRLDKMVSNLLASSTEYPNSNAVLAKLALKADAANPVFTGDLTISGATPRLYFVDTDQNPDYTIFVDSGYFYIYDQTAGATKFQITPSGNAINSGTLTSTSFIKSGGTASQYLMADGSVTTLSGLVTGSGTTNYLSKWTSGSAIGNSLIYDSGTKIGIGTATPYGLVEINGNGNAWETAPAIRMWDTLNSKGWLIGTVNNYAAGDFYIRTLPSISTNPGSTELQFIIKHSTGNILINTATDAGYKFDVNGTGRFTGNVNIGTYLSLGTGSGKFLAVGGAVTAGSSADLLMYNTGGDLIFWGKGAVGMIIKATNGNVAIGTTNASSRFNVKGDSSNSQIEFNNFSTGQNYILSYDRVANAYRDFIITTNSNNNGLVVTTSGNVGIGTSTPSGKLEVNGQTNIINGAINFGGSGSAGSTDPAIYRIGGINDLAFAIGSAERMRINSSGNFDYGGYNVQSSNNSNYRQAFYGGVAIMWRGAEDAYIDSNHTFSSSNTNVATYTSGNGIGRLSFAGGELEWDAYNGSVNAGSAYGLSVGFLAKKNGNFLIGSTTDNGNKLQVNGSTSATSYGRSAAGTGFLNGKYSGVETTATTGPIYCLGDSYVPTATSTGSMYGIGYSYNSFTGAYGPVNDWGMYVVGGGTVGIYLSAGGNGYYRGSVTATSFFESSDFRLKNLIEHNPIVSGIEKLEAKLYEKDGKIELGYFAQDAELIMPYAVTKNADGFLNLSYREVHTAKIARLEQRVAELEKQLNLN